MVRAAGRAGRRPAGDDDRRLLRPRYADGALLDLPRARAAGVAAEHQVGAIRWWHPTGLAHQIYVGSAHRRRGVGGMLIQVAFALQTAHGLPALHEDGQRTELGQRFTEGLPGYVAWRLGPRTHTLQPM